MASVTNRPNGHRWIQFVDPAGRRQTLRLGKSTKKHADEVCRRVELLLSAKLSGDSVDRQTAAWLKSIDGPIRERLVKVGLAEPSAGRMRLGEWIDKYIESRSDIKGNSLANYQRTRRSLVDFFTEDRPLETITPGDAEDWRIWLATKSNRRDKGRKTLADETVRRRSGRAKQFFNAAIKRGLVESNPFEDLVGTQRGNPKRQHFVHAQIIYDCIEHAPDTQWRTIIALCRFGGLRCPTEVLGLKWDDVDLAGGKMTIHAPKTAHCASGGVRACPIFPELRPYLEDAEELAEPGTIHVITRYRDTNANLRTTFKKIITRAGHQAWPRLFQNLRATRETELMAKYPAKDVAAWLGNSVPVAMLHYAMATAESFERAIQERSTPERRTLNGADSSEAEKGEAEPEAVTRQNAKHKPKQQAAEPDGGNEQKQKKPSKNRANSQPVASACHCTPDEAVHPRGFEPLTFGSVDTQSFPFAFRMLTKTPLFAGFSFVPTFPLSWISRRFCALVGRLVGRFQERNFVGCAWVL
ncbi:site-specific tyrosine recombinase XerC [Rubripirellula obstinata]|uniref:Site-specific tyrosine recombinase XerC n=1 Tax=Rubripirellula obstinata TaxID=406547 RepID=A0A5B1CBS0_9BACT|nr:phage integrase SAM-like domain-containing protein [Rubripirellula obstinata]KAA1258618.1 site-specific tyrosine recombinase XerC [Rubripirellula obstinata]